ncbi:MAG: carbamoyltransferase N-terminal domain-containing protein, partial [Gemmatimonadota bacterium]
MADSHTILGISAFYHDSAACILRDGEIVAAAQEERFSRRKHDARYPERAIAYCLGDAGVTSEDLDLVAFYEKPWVKFERLVETYVAFAPRGLRSFLMAMPLWLNQKLWIETRIRERLGTEAPFVFPEHHESHAASAFFPSPFQRAAILTSDGVGEWTTSSWGLGTGSGVELREEQRFPHSLGLLYSAFTYYCGFKVNSGEYKLMGLAPYGNPKYVDLILDELIDLRPDGSFRLNMRYFKYPYGLRMTTERFHRLFGGPPRAPESELTQRYIDVARSIQDVLEEAVVRAARHVRAETGERNLCMAGGVALNAVANGRILREGIFDDIWIQPASGDAGGALGAALVAYHHVLGRPREADGQRDTQRASLLGPRYTTADIEAWLRAEGIPHHSIERDDVLLPRVARLLADGRVVGWFTGRMEFGPRALGARSILADPRDPEMQSLINRKIKFRESFRPFAPACLREEVSRYFELDRAAPYMLIVVPVRADGPRGDPDAPVRPLRERLAEPRGELPAVTHVVDCSRLQSVAREDHPR